MSVYFFPPMHIQKVLHLFMFSFLEMHLNVSSLKQSDFIFHMQMDQVIFAKNLIHRKTRAHHTIMMSSYYGSHGPRLIHKGGENNTGTQKPLTRRPCWPCLLAQSWFHPPLNFCAQKQHCLSPSQPG